MLTLVRQSDLPAGTGDVRRWTAKTALDSGSDANVRGWPLTALATASIAVSPSKVPSGDEPAERRL